MKETYISVNKETRYVNIGTMIDDELFTIQVNIIDNSHSWGILVVDPDGNTYYELVNKEKESIEIKFVLESDSLYRLMVTRYKDNIDISLTEY